MSSAQDSTHDPLSRFLEITFALRDILGPTSNPHAYKFTAMAAMNCDGEVNDIAKEILTMRQEMDQAQSMRHLSVSLKYVINALLLLNRDSVKGFVAEAENVSDRFRELNLRRGDVFETIAILLMRIENGLDPVATKTIERFVGIYEAMKKNHWWLTGPDDFPACALLSCRDESVEFLGDGIENLYKKLNERGFHKGDPLQTATHLLYLVYLQTEEALDRFINLADQIDKTEVEFSSSLYADIAHLSVFNLPVSDVVSKVLVNMQRVKDAGAWQDQHVTFSVASAVTFLEFIKESDDPQQLLSTRSLDQSAITTAQVALRCGSLI